MYITKIIFIISLHTTSNILQQRKVIISHARKILAPNYDVIHHLYQDFGINHSHVLGRLYHKTDRITTNAVRCTNCAVIRLIFELNEALKIMMCESTRK